MKPQRKERRRNDPLPTPRSGRRWRVPPPLIHGPEPLEAGGILVEVREGLGVLLWESLRDVMLWSATPPEDRPALFCPGAAEQRREVLALGSSLGALTPSLQVMASVLTPGAEVDVKALAGACEEAAWWAERRGHLATALAFAQAVALLLPDDASAAYGVGILARRRAEYARAETWFRRTVMISRQTGDWRSYSLAFVGLGKLYVQRGNFPVARKLQIRAQRAARRHSLRPIEGMALHDLFVTAASTGEAAEAEQFAAAALQAYGSDSRVPALAHDVAYFWLERGHFARALPVFQAVLPHMEQPADRVRVLADIARAAAGAGDSALFERAWRDAVEMVARPEAEEGVAQALLDLANGAAMLGRWEDSELVAVRALERATERNEGRVRLMAEALLESVHNGRMVRQRALPGSPRGDALATGLVEYLNAVTSG